MHVVQVLTTGSWPTQMAAKCNLPRELEHCCKAFQDYYLKAHSGRKLSWQTNMGNADLKARASCDMLMSNPSVSVLREVSDCHYGRVVYTECKFVLSSMRRDATCEPLNKMWAGLHEP